MSRTYTIDEAPQAFADLESGVNAARCDPVRLIFVVSREGGQHFLCIPIRNQMTKTESRRARNSLFLLVEPRRIELLTFALRTRRSPS